MADRVSCARICRALHEPLLATASQVTRWVLVEQPGSWGSDALRESGLPQDVAEELIARCRRWQARPLLIRQRRGRDDARRRIFVASSTPDDSWLRRFELDDVAEVLDLDLDALFEGAAVAGERVDDGLLLTCTNGRHDACCAEYGRGVAAALEDAFGAQAWECSHIGGDRFAANVVCLPEGIYYGQVTPTSAVGIGALHRSGSLSLPHYRGRSTWPFDVQAAETLLRTHLGVDGIDAVRPLHVARPERGRVDVEVAVAGQRWQVELDVWADPTPQQLTCGSPRRGHPSRYTARSVRRADGARDA